MGGKAKGKQRQDKFYHLAKEQGYRSRASFKLLQLDAKYQFLPSSRSILDLCAAPGGWLQVAVRHAPVGSFILGIDLFPIRPVRGAHSIIQDITTSKCRSEIKKLMDQNGCSAFDCVLHDGSPNVGANWSKDATSQSALVVDSVRLATMFLSQKGTFVTKVFRSQDLLMAVDSSSINRRTNDVQDFNATQFQYDIGDCDPWTAWAYKPRTISLLLIGTCLLIWASGALDPESTASHDVVTSVKRGVWAMIVVYLAYSLLQAPSTLLIRPHPAIWRMVHGMAVVYLVALTFLLFQNRDDARQFMKFLHPDLGIELPERSYGADCRIYVPDNPKNRFINVYDTLFDEFVLAHIFGWWGKAIMIRNQPLLWVLSIGFELMELTFRHMLPNFNECWWDSIILDILICNWFGIWAGMHTVRYFDGKTYEWVGLSRQPNILAKVKRTLGQFTPARWDKDEWHPLLGPWRFIQVLTLCVIFMTVELNTFFLKFCLWIPPRNPIITYRLVLWWLIAIPTIREYNTYLQDRKPVKKVGAFCWLALAICIVELLICIKFGHGLFPDPMPAWLIVFWSSIGIALAVFLLLWSWQIRITIQRKRR